MRLRARRRQTLVAHRHDRFLAVHGHDRDKLLFGSSGRAGKYRGKFGSNDGDQIRRILAKIGHVFVTSAPLDLVRRLVGASSAWSRR